jgi:YD repeat-containing protein
LTLKITRTLGRLLVIVTLCSLFADLGSTNNALGPRILAAAEVEYIYDDVGRLIAVIDETGDLAVYRYDAVGNLLAVDRGSTTGSTSFIDFSPKRGPVGTAVTIRGTGFSATPAANAVTFNGVAAVVDSSSATQIKTIVPAGASTGAIGITSPIGASTSTQPFIVIASASEVGPPSISSFNPLGGVAGTAVTILGSGFNAAPGGNVVAFNGVPATVITANGSEISTEVPGGAGSGRLTVRTSYGDATSAADFLVPPGAYGVTDIASSGRGTVNGGAVTATVASANKIAVVLFDGSTGQHVSIGLSNSTLGTTSCCSADVVVYDPFGSELASTRIGTGDDALDLLLSASGTYVVVVDPDSTKTGSVTVTVSEEVGGSIAEGGSSVTVSITREGQRARLTFDGTAGDKVNLGLFGSTIGSTTYTTTVVLYAPDGNTVADIRVGSKSGALDATLPYTGRYSIVVNPDKVFTGNLTATLSQELSSTITVGGNAVTEAIMRPGQQLKLVFDAAAGQRLGLGVTGASGSTTCCAFVVRILDPDGQELANGSAGTRPIDVDFVAPATGTHTIHVDPNNVNTGSLTLTLSDELGGTIVLDGGPVDVSVPRFGQRARLSFASVAAQQLRLEITNASGTSSCCTMTVEVRGPTGSLLGSATVGTRSRNIDFTPQSSDTYFVIVDPYDGKTGSLRLNLRTP